MIRHKRYTPETLWRIVRRRKWVLLAPFVLIAGATALVAHHLPNRYRSETVIVAVPQQVPTSYVQPTVTTRLDERLLSINQRILSRTRLEQIILEFDLYAVERKTSDLEDVIERMRRRDIDVEVRAGSRSGRQTSAPTVRVAYAGRDARTVQLVTERLASFFIEENLRDRAALADGTNQFLEVQLQEARNRLIRHEKRLEAYRTRFAGELPSQLGTNIQMAQSIELQLQSLAQSITQDSDRRLVLEQLLEEFETAAPIIPLTSPPDRQVEDADAAPLPAARELELAHQQLHALELRLKPAHPDLARAKRTIVELQRKAEEEALQQALSPSPKKVETVVFTQQDHERQVRIREMQVERDAILRRIVGKETEQTRLLETLAGYQAIIAAVPARETELVELTRDYETLKQIYAGLLAKSEHARAAAELERRQIGEQFKLLDPARLPDRPVSPNRAQINGAGALGGLAIGVGLLWLLEYRDRTLRTEQEVLDALELPVLALVPTMVGARERRQRLVDRRCIRLIAAAAHARAVKGRAAGDFLNHRLPHAKRDGNDR
jgi:polysaccharide chain length determinant protein (PEP-CTERM system associated)